VTQATVAVLDPTALESLRRFGGEKLLREMTALFLSSAPPRLATARVAAAANDAEGVRRAAHSLKSSAGQLGAMAMQQLCDQAESLAVAGSHAQLLPLVAEIEAAFGLVQSALEETRHAG